MAYRNSSQVAEAPRFQPEGCSDVCVSMPPVNLLRIRVTADNISRLGSPHTRTDQRERGRVEGWVKPLRPCNGAGKTVP